MADVVPEEVRSRMMSGIRSKNTKPEMMIWKGLHALGLRFRLHDKRLPGKPDIVLPQHKAVIFVHGCFWHGHACSLFKWPSTRHEFWRQKIYRNKEVDQRAEAALIAAGWRYAVVWECSLRGRRKLGIPDVLERCTRWITSDELRLEVSELTCL